MVMLMKNVVSYGVGRRHIEVPKEYYVDFPVGIPVVVISKDEYDVFVASRIVKKK